MIKITIHKDLHVISLAFFFEGEAKLSTSRIKNNFVNNYWTIFIQIFWIQIKIINEVRISLFLFLISDFRILFFVRIIVFCEPRFYLRQNSKWNIKNDETCFQLFIRLLFLNIWSSVWAIEITHLLEWLRRQKHLFRIRINKFSFDRLAYWWVLNTVQQISGFIFSFSIFDQLKLLLQISNNHTEYSKTN